jgi:2-polyprenyl-3-methyl-5-hydroxy-6-metoxy-1,4-benzoquinol methylase
MVGFADRELHGIEIVGGGFSRPAYDEQIEFIESVLRPRSVVDIGCGRAQLLVELRYRGLDWDHLYGYDIGFDIGKGQVPFDLAIMSHSLEHMLDPVTKLRHAITMVRDDGYVFIEVPAFNHRVGMLEVPHIWYWDRSALERLLHYVRLDVVKSEQPYHRRVMAQPRSDQVGH